MGCPGTNGKRYSGRRRGLAFVFFCFEAATVTPGRTLFSIETPPVTLSAMSPVKPKPVSSAAPLVAYNTNLRAPITTIVGEVPEAAVHAR